MVCPYRKTKNPYLDDSMLEDSKRAASRKETVPNHL